MEGSGGAAFVRLFDLVDQGIRCKKEDSQDDRGFKQIRVRGIDVQKRGMGTGIEARRSKTRIPQY